MPSRPCSVLRAAATGSGAGGAWGVCGDEGAFPSGDSLSRTLGEPGPRAHTCLSHLGPLHSQSHLGQHSLLTAATITEHLLCTWPLGLFLTGAIINVPHGLTM